MTAMATYDVSFLQNGQTKHTQCLTVEGYARVALAYICTSPFPYIL